MKNVNKIFITFALLVIFLIGSVWQFLQTETFARLTANYVQEKILKDVKWNLKFGYIDVDMFPPATILKDVTLNDESGIHLDVDSLGLYFSFWDLISSKWTIEKIGIDGGLVKIGSLDKEKKGQEKLSFKNFFKYYQEKIYPKIPFDIEKIQFSDLHVVGKGFKLYSENTLVRVEKSKVRVETTIFNVKSQKLKKYINSDFVDEFKCKVLFTDKGIRLYHLNIKDRLLRIRINGGIKSKEKDLEGELGFEVVGDIGDLLKRVKMTKVQNKFNGTFSVRGQMSGSIAKPQVDFKLDVRDFKSEYAAGKSVEINGGVEQDVFFIDKIHLTTNSGVAKLAERFNILDLKKKKVIDQFVKVKAKHIHTSEALKVAEEILGPIKGYITGGVKISWDEDIKIEVNPQTTVENFELKFNDAVPVLQNNELVFQRGMFVVENDGPVLINAELSFGTSSINVRGSVGDKDLNFRCRSEQFDFEDFGPISGEQIRGKGIVEAVISGPHEKVQFDFKVNHTDAEVFGFNLGSINTNIILDLATLDLKIKRLEGMLGGTNYRGTGSVGFHSNYPIKLLVDVPRGSYKDSQYIYKVLLDMMDSFPKTLSFTYSGKYSVEGNIENHEYEVNGSMRAKNVWWMGEEMDRVTTNFKYKNDQLVLNDIVMLKKEGSLSGMLTYNYKKKAVKYEATFSKIRCKDIFYYKAMRLGLDGEMEGTLKGESDGVNISSSSIIKVINSKIGNASVRNSLVTIYNNKSDLFVNGNIVGDLITFDSYINLQGKGKKSYVNLSVISERINILAGILSDHNYNDSNLKGRVMANLNSKFDIKDVKTLDLMVNIEDFRIKKGNSRLILNKNKRSIFIKNGNIEKWGIEVKGGTQLLRSNGEGSFGKKVRINNDFNIDNALGTIITPYVESASGKSHGSLLYIHSGDSFKVHMKASGTQVGLKVKSFPNQFKKISYKLILEDDELLIDHVRGEYGGGRLKADGNVIFKFPLPIINIAVDVERANIGFFNKSSTTVSAGGKIVGSSLPYKLYGDVNLTNTKVYDDLASLYKLMGLKGGASKYLPANILRNRIIYYNYDVNMNFKESAHVKNSMLDLFVTGGCRVGGTFDDLKLDGDFKLTPKISKIRFTGRDFLLSEGGVKLNEKEPPRYSLVGETALNEYMVRLEAIGESAKIDIKLTSEPSLPQQDIVSLLTLGVTSDISQNLETEDRQSVTSVGLGALLVDQLRINEGLNQSLGMQLSVMPEFEQDEDASMLSGRTEGSNITAGNLKSATKIKLQKKILGVDVSVSSTVGGSMKQKQEMKVKWDLMKNISLEGIYEIKNSDDEEIDTNESVGADVKIRWSF